MTVALAVLALTVTVAFAQDPADPVPISGTAGDDQLSGTPAADALFGLAGNDAIFGLEGDDDIDGGPGADLMSGGPGSDSVSYSGGAPVTVTLDNVADDGVAGESDNVGKDIEDVYGGDGPDRLVGSSAENTLDGGLGNDTIDGGAGPDGLFGDEGDDRIVSRDGSTDRVECGPGDDVAIVDSRDIVRECEQVGREAVTQRFLLDIEIPRGRATRMHIYNVTTGSRVVIACISRCRPASSAKRAILTRRKVTARGGRSEAIVALRRSPAIVRGSTFEIGVKAPRSRVRCTRFRLSKGLVRLKTSCRSVARDA